VTERDETLDAFEVQLRTAFAEVLSSAPAGELLDALAGTALAILDDDACNRYAEQVVNETHLKTIDFRNGMAMELEPSRDMVAAWVGAARGMLGDAENYSETPIEMEVKVAESPESFVFILQRVGKLTPHQARQRAEARVAELESVVKHVRTECHLIVTEVYGQHDEDDDGMREAVRRILSVVDGPNSQPATSCYQIGRSDPVAAVDQRIAALRSGNSQPTVTNHTFEGVGHGQPCQAEAFGETCGAPWEQHEMRDEE